MKECVDGMLASTDELFMAHFEFGTPEYNCQQSLMKAAARYRLSQHKEKRNESETTAR